MSPSGIKEPGASVAKLARGNGINANMLFMWRRRYREQLQAQTTSLIPVAVVDETPAQRVTTPSDARAVGNRTARAGTIEIRFGDVVVKVDGIVDADTLRVVLGSMRSRSLFPQVPESGWWPASPTLRDPAYGNG
ncbi:MAG: transposase [Burkholderiales bacterium]|nr:transposase [Burkholderiales bacterium]